MRHSIEGSGRYLKLNDEDLRIHTYLEQKKAYLRNNNKTKKVFAYVGVDCFLSFDEVKRLLKKANISIYQVGKCRGEYQLARKNDKGNYEIGNCEFILTEENQKQKKQKYYAKAGETITFRNEEYASYAEIERKLDITVHHIKKEMGLIEEKSEKQKRKEKLKQKSFPFRGEEYVSVREVMLKFDMSRYHVEKEMNISKQVTKKKYEWVYIDTQEVYDTKNDLMKAKRLSSYEVDRDKLALKRKRK